MNNYDPGNFFHSTPMVFGESLSLLGGIGLIVLGIVTLEIKPIMAGTTMVTGGGAGLAYASRGRNKGRPPTIPPSSSLFPPGWLEEALKQPPKDPRA